MNKGNPGLDRTQGQNAPAIRLQDFPMYYFAAIQAQNLKNATRLLTELEISPPEWRILNLVASIPSLTLGDLAEFSVIERSSASRAVTRLVDAGLLQRRDKHADRRKGMVELTEAGRACLARADRIMRALYRENLRDVSDEDFNALMRILKTIHANTLNAGMRLAAEPVTE